MYVTPSYIEQFLRNMGVTVLFENSGKKFWKKILEKNSGKKFCPKNFGVYIQFDTSQ